MGQPRQDALRVSVIVPVYNTGAHIEELIRSLAAQTLPADQFECIFVDDGSTDDTPARLDRLADERANVTVFHEPNSGWPGRPRNIGIDRARGTYVFFVDHDDWLGTEALERMTAMADAESADILVPRYAGHNRAVAKALFERPRPNASLANAPLMDSLTPHKMFRRAFLTEHNLRFPEGRRRLEDHVFVTEAYFLADRISVLTDYHCYYHVGRADAGNAGYQRIDPQGYYGNVREVVAVVLKHTEPGTVRDRYLRRILRIEILSRLSGKIFLEQDPAYQRAVFAEGRQVAMESMPLSVDAGLPPAPRVAAYLLRADDFDDLMHYAQWEQRLRAEASLVDLGRVGGALHLTVGARLVAADTGSPWTYGIEGDSVRVAAVPGLRTQVPLDAADCTSAIQNATAQIALRRRQNSDEWALDTDTAIEINDADDAPWIAFRAAARADPRTSGGGHDLGPGIWDVYVRVRQTGWTKQARLAGPSSPADTLGSGAIGVGTWLVVPFLTDKGNLSLRIEARGGIRRRMRRAAGATVRRLRGTRR